VKTAVVSPRSGNRHDQRILGSYRKGRRSLACALRLLHRGSLAARGSPRPRFNTEMNRVRLVLSKINNRTFGPYLAATDRNLISVVKDSPGTQQPRVRQPVFLSACPPD
jgi:hypothetical protein